MQTVANFIKVSKDRSTPNIDRLSVVKLDGYSRTLIEYKSLDGDRIPAFLFEPESERSSSHPAVMIHHQHNGEHFLGKSEVAGIQGDPFQAFGPALAKRGFIVLAPDQICFEDRRRKARGTQPDKDDFLQQFNEMTYRLVLGDTLMRKVLDDAIRGFSVLMNHEKVDRARIGIMGHSLGGNTSLFHAAVDERIRFVCSSGALCSYKNKMLEETSFEMNLAIPGILEHFEMKDIVGAISSKAKLIVSAKNDKYSKDADEVLNGFNLIEHFRFNGGHALDQERFNAIVDWVTNQ